MKKKNPKQAQVPGKASMGDLGTLVQSYNKSLQTLYADMKSYDQIVAEVDAAEVSLADLRKLFRVTTDMIRSQSDIIAQIISLFARAEAMSELPDISSSTPQETN